MSLTWYFIGMAHTEEMWLPFFSFPVAPVFRNNVSLTLKFFNRLHDRYPAYLPALQRAIELWYGEPACTTPILKLMAELMQNR